MPKMKSKSAVKKRIKLTASGKMKRGRANGSHILTKKSAKRKLRLGTSTTVHPADYKRLRRLICS